MIPNNELNIVRAYLTTVSSGSQLTEISAHDESLGSRWDRWVDRVWLNKTINVIVGSTIFIIDKQKNKESNTFVYSKSMIAKNLLKNLSDTNRSSDIIVSGGWWRNKVIKQNIVTNKSTVSKTKTVLQKNSNNLFKTDPNVTNLTLISAKPNTNTVTLMEVRELDELSMVDEDEDPLPKIQIGEPLQLNDINHPLVRAYNGIQNNSQETILALKNALNQYQGYLIQSCISGLSQLQEKSSAADLKKIFGLIATEVLRQIQETQNVLSLFKYASCPCDNINSNQSLVGHSIRRDTLSQILKTVHSISTNTTAQDLQTKVADFSQDLVTITPELLTILSNIAKNIDMLTVKIPTKLKRSN